ncbi:hypothetical protein BDZ97DRAFT_1842912 [Flammula alnicola]|nr:hypothetical protein BDZ97DRAFT_1842912 [Flammula alnicola]
MAKTLKQCQNCLKTGSETPLSFPSKDCQIADWKNHKVLCKMTRETREKMKDNPNNSKMALVGVSVADAENTMKKWVQQFRALLTVTVVQALKLRSTPERYTEIRRAFELVDAEVISMKDIQEIHPDFEVVPVDPGEIKIVRTQDPDGIGYSIVVISAPECNVLRMTPLGVEGPPSDLPPWNPEWKKQLRQ